MAYKRLIKKDILYPELSYKIVGVLFDAFNKVGPGYGEKYYQKAISELFRFSRIPFKEQSRVEVNLGGGKKLVCFLDFLIDGKVILEIKKGERFLKSNIDQVFGYLKATGLKLGILANFTKSGVQFKRVLNIRN